MPYNGSGVYEAPINSFNPAVSATTIASSDWNTLLSDLESGLTNCVTKDGQTTITANLPMGGFKHTNVAAASARNHYADVAAVQDSKFMWGGTAGGSANAQTVTLSPAITALGAGMVIAFIPTADNTGACTLNPNGIGATNIKMQDGTDPTAGVLDATGLCVLRYNGTNLIVMGGDVFETATQTLTNKTLTSAVLNTGVSGTAVLDEDNMSSDDDTKIPTQQSVKAYIDKNPVLLDPPVALVSAGSTTNSWVTVDMSSVYPTAFNDGATFAIVKVETISQANTTVVQTDGYLRKTGSGAGLTAVTHVTSDESRVTGGATNLRANDVNTTIVALDGNSDFDWYQTLTGGGNDDMNITLLGYYTK